MFLDHIFLALIVFMALYFILVRGLNYLLIWLDRKDCILIPNQDAITNANRRFDHAIIELHTLIEPSPKHILDHAQALMVKVDEDEAGDKAPPDKTLI